ncbi:MAG: cell division protein ZapA [Alphaproteobacteria bacterium]|nr:cell division protein ZapA [Alphaproteobacteria bacterium]
MAMVEIEIASRRYSIACRDGEEPHLIEVAALVDGKARDAAAALGGLSESRQLLIASLMLADELYEARSAAPRPAGPVDDEIAADALERVADRVERLASRLENER